MTTLTGIRSRRRQAAIVAMVDSHSAVIDRLVDRTLTRVDVLRAQEPHGVSDHMGDAPRQSFHAGTRGETSGDAAQRARTSARRRFINRIAPAIAEAAGNDEWIVIGGNRVICSALRKALAKAGREAILVDGVGLTQSAETIKDRVTSAILEHMAAVDIADVTSLLERTGAHTTGVVGPIATLDAVEHGAADVVLMTPRYRQLNTVAADELERTAHQRGARIDMVADGAATLLDQRGGGVGALLRFALHAMPAVAAHSTAR